MKSKTKTTKRPMIPRPDNLRTVKQMAEEYPNLFSEPRLRWLIFRADQNGFARCVIRAGGRVFIDLDQIRLWLHENRDEEVSMEV